MISLVRKNQWEQKLFAYTSGVLQKPFEWGVHDCVLFAADCIEAMTGEDLAAEYRGTYSTSQGAAKIVHSAGVESLGDFLAMYLPETPVPFLQRGDIALCDGPEWQFVGVCQGRTCVGPSEKGLIHVNNSQVIRAFKVG